MFILQMFQKKRRGTQVKRITILDDVNQIMESDSEDGEAFDDDEGGKAAKGSEKTIEQMYQKKTQLEHILLRPDTYIGSTEPTTESMFVFDKDAESIVEKEITFTPGFYKIFDFIDVLLFKVVLDFTRFLSFLIL